MQNRLLSLILLTLISVFVWSCSDDEEDVPPTATGTPEPTATVFVPPTQTPSPTPSPTPTPLPQLSAGDAIIVGGAVRTRSDPSTASEPVGTLDEFEPVRIAARVQGENWLVGSQTWVPSVPAWASEWFQLEDGSYVYGPFVFLLGQNEVSPFAEVPAGKEKWIDVDLSEQRARAMVGDEAVFVAAISSGEPAFPTPKGTFAIQGDGRIAVERMTATQAGYAAEQAQYDVERVLFTQYFDLSGNALHLNYWRPHSVFGRVATSHGCIGLELHEAQYFWLFAEADTRVEIHD
jgi:hypothetical protein